MVTPNGPPSGSIPVPLGRQERRRSDAERNRLRLLDCAQRLVARRGLDALTMDHLAAEAGVGKGTVYRAFGSRAGVAEALVDQAEHDLQLAVLDGPPPLGPGASAPERVAAFAAAYLDMLDTNVDLFVAVDHAAAGRRFTTGSYAFWRAHVTGLAEAAGRPNPSLTAELILGLLAADLYRHMRATAPSCDLRDALTTAAVRLVNS